MARDRILRAALELFGRDGVAATTLSRLRTASGVSVGGFYHHFAGNDQVAEALFVECSPTTRRGSWRSCARMGARAGE